MTLRQYQRDSVDAVWDHIRHKQTNPCVVLPTGAGKTHVIAQICKDAVAWNGRVIVLAHVKELLEQNASKIRAAIGDDSVGVYSAGLNSRESHLPITVAGIQSVYRRAAEFDPFHIIMVDEAHLIPEEGDGMYRQFIEDAKKASPDLRVVGLTATPYRLKSGMICTPDNILNEICHEVNVRELIAQGYLSPLKNWEGQSRPDFSGVAIRGGDYVMDALEQVAKDPTVVTDAVAEIIAATQDRKSVLIFCCGVAHAHCVAEAIENACGQPCGVVTGMTASEERAETLDDFKAGHLKYLANVNVLTTGFDAPNIDCVVMLRPTKSAGLYYQMVGRGFRLHPGKDHCRVLDFGQNVERHGPVDSIVPTIVDMDMPKSKTCKNCTAIVDCGIKICPECGHHFPTTEPKSPVHSRAAGTASIIDNGEKDTHDVIDVEYSRHDKRGNPDAPPTMRVEYRVGTYKWEKEWVCIEHTGYARKKAEDWWAQRSNEPCPFSVDEAVDIARDGGLASPTSITVERKPGEQYARVSRCVLGPKPPIQSKPDGNGLWVQEWSADGSDYTPDEVPF